MSKKSNLNIGMSRRPRRGPSGQASGSTARPGGGLRKTGRKNPTASVDIVDPTLGRRLRRYIPVVLFPLGVVILLIIALSIVGLLLASAPMSALPATIAQSWLAVNGLPVAGGGYVVGVMPLVPCMVLIAVLSRRVHDVVKDRVSIADLAVLGGCVVGIPLLLTLTAIAMLYDASYVFDVAVPPLLPTLLKTVLVHSVVMAFGMGRRLWKAIARRLGVPLWVVDQAVSAGWIIIIGLILAAVAYLVSIGVHHGTLQQIMDNYHGWGLFGALLLSVLYLPNAAIVTLAVTAGSEFAMGDAVVGLFGVTLVPLPPLPLLAGVPAAPHPLGAGLLALPAVAVVIAVFKSVPRFTELPALITFSALWMLLLTVMTHGDVGVYGVTGPKIFLSTGLYAAWVAVVGVIMATVGYIIQKPLLAAVQSAESEEHTAVSVEPEGISESDDIPEGDEYAEFDEALAVDEITAAEEMSEVGVSSQIETISAPDFEEEMAEPEDLKPRDVLFDEVESGPLMTNAKGEDGELADVVELRTFEQAQEGDKEASDEPVTNVENVTKDNSVTEGAIYIRNETESGEPEVEGLEDRN
ncbi:MAG: DUF6350 family protein [Corynebacterium sp.]|uniref:cell division protein PerM n=1 Tax=Corynebacterium sp. TaxID=1720 RepID=UPI0026DD5C19|nr:DUF6350 family protein [Corynebacterium sp.]MDO5097312.1 DUF6350 family protein [Corynebacterium sp.]